MKIGELAKELNADYSTLSKFVKESGYEIKSGLFDNTVDDGAVPAIRSGYIQYKKDLNEKKALTAQERAQAEEEAQREEEAMRAELAQIMVTSGYNFEGYRIVRYSGYISGDDAVQVERGTSVIFGLGAKDAGEALMQSLSKIRSRALAELKQAAWDLDCNAVIGVDFDYITLDPQTANISGGTTYLPYVFGVTANGTAVQIEKIE